MVFFSRGWHFFAHMFVKLSKYVYTQLEPNFPLFWRVDLPFYCGSNLSTYMDYLGSRCAKTYNTYTHVYIYIYMFIWYINI